MLAIHDVPTTHEDVDGLMVRLFKALRSGECLELAAWRPVFAQGWPAEHLPFALAWFDQLALWADRTGLPVENIDVLTSLVDALRPQMQTGTAAQRAQLGLTSSHRRTPVPIKPGGLLSLRLQNDI